MKERRAVLLMAVVLASVPARAQRARRPGRAKVEDTGPVMVSRSATLRVSIASDAVTVFEHLSDSKKLEQWLPDQAIMEPQLGGKYHFRWKDREGVWSGVVTQFIRGNTLGFTWQPPGEDMETNVLFKLSPQGGQTVVELTHSGFTTSEEAMEKAIKSWVFYLQNLKSVIESGTDMRSQPSPPARKRPPARRRRG